VRDDAEPRLAAREQAQPFQRLLRTPQPQVENPERPDGTADGGADGGPGTGIAADGDIVGQVRKRRLPLVGDGAGVWSFVHIDDAASAAVAALGHGAPGVYNIADDEPAPVAAWLPELAAAVGAGPPRHVPVWLGRLAAGEVGVSMMTRIRGTSNAKARRELGWEPRYRSYREGFRHGLDDQAPTRHLLIGTSSVNWP